MTRRHGFLAANVVLVAAAFALIAPDWFDDDAEPFVLRGLTITGPLHVAPSALDLQRVVTATNQMTTVPATAVPATRATLPIAGPDLFTGRRVSLAQFRGRPVFVSLWRTDNVGTVDEASTIARFARVHRGEIVYLGVNAEDSEHAARAFARRNGMTFPSISDRTGRLAYSWSFVPTTLVFDRRHRLVRKIYGAATKAQLDAALRGVTRP